MKKIIVYDNSGHAFPVQLSRSLAKNELNVLHLYSNSFQSPKGNLEKFKSDSETLEIRGIALPTEFKKYSYIRRLRQERLFGRLINGILATHRPDILIACNVPLETLKIVQKECEKNQIKLIFWVQDFYGIAIRKILSKKLSFLGKWIGNYYINLEKTILNKSNYIVLITHHFVDVLKEINVDSKDYSVIPNWAPIDEIQVEDKINEWSVLHNLNDKFCFMYTGTLGLKHRPELLLKLAESFKAHDDVRIVVISEGIGADWLQAQRLQNKYENLVVLEFQPFGFMSKVMGTADILVSILDKDAGVYSVPSKILAYMCAQRPILLSVPKENLASLMVSESNCGMIADPDDDEEFIRLAKKLYDSKENRETMGLNARKNAVKYFDINSIAAKFSTIIEKI